MLRILGKQLEMLNKHLAVNKKNLNSLLKEENPKIVLRDGSTHSFRAEELKKIAAILPQETHEKLFLPIYIELSLKYGSGTARVTGALECKIVASILGREVKDAQELFIYKPEIKRLRKKLPTTTQYMFTLVAEGDV